MAEPAEMIRRQQRDTTELSWDLWGTNRAERQWGTVRENDFADGDHWNSFPFDHSHRRT